MFRSGCYPVTTYMYTCTIRIVRSTERRTAVVGAAIVSRCSLVGRSYTFPNSGMFSCPCRSCLHNTLRRQWSVQGPSASRDSRRWQRRLRAKYDHVPQATRDPSASLGGPGSVSVSLVGEQGRCAPVRNTFLVGARIRLLRLCRRRCARNLSGIWRGGGGKVCAA